MNWIKILGLTAIIFATFLPGYWPDNNSPVDYVELTRMVGEVGGYPKIASDIYGNVYVSWLSWNDEQTGYWIYFSRYGDSRWMQPADILYSTGQIQLCDMVVTADGEISILWAAGNSVNLSQCSALDCMDTHNWNTSVVVKNDNSLPLTNMPHLVLAETEGLWVVSWSIKNGIYINASHDGGATWEASQLIYEEPDSRVGIANGSLILTEDSLHIAWTELSESKNWSGQAIWHACLDRENFDIEYLREVYRTSPHNGPTVGWPSLVYAGNSRLFLFWDNGVGSDTGRFYQESMDNGDTWGDINNIFSGKGGLSGQTGLTQLVVDSNQTAHIFTAAYNSSDGTQVRYFSGSPSLWSSYWTLKTDGLSSDDEFVSVTITGGNTIHIVWHDRLGRVFYASIVTSAPAIPPLERPAMLEVSPTEQVASEPTSTALVNLYSSPEDLIEVNPLQANTSHPFLIGGLVVVILIGCVALIYFIKLAGRRY